MRTPRDATLAWKIVHLLITLMRPYVCRFRVEGREHVPVTGGVVLACNHPGELDVVVLGYASPRQIYYMAKQELFHVHPLLTWLITLAGAFPVRRGQQDVGAVSQSIKLVQQGKVLGMFPEGTRDRDRGLTRGRNGAVRIALETGAPVVPAAVIGVSALNRDWSHPFRRPQVTVRFGKPIYFQKAEHETSETLQTRTDEVMRAVAAMLPPELQGIYAETEET